MNSLIRTSLIVVILTFAGLAPARATERPADAARIALQREGMIPIQSAGRYVAPGTWRVQVSVKLGRPDAVLPDGSWLYAGHRVAGSDATGTLIVRFERNRVSALQLARPEIAAALPSRDLPPAQVAAK